MFQNLPMNVLHLLIINKFLDCEDILEDDQSLSALWLSFGTTLFMIGYTIYSSFSVAKAHKENCLEKFMIQMTAQNDWVPFLHLVNNKQGELAFESTDFSQIVNPSS